MNAHIPQPQTRPAARKPWSAPSISQMPPLRDLTLQTGFANGSDSAPGFTYG